MKDYITLKGLVMSKYDTLAEFATACGHTKQWASKVLKNPERLTITQAVQIRELLGIPEEQMTLDLFLPK